MQAVDTNVLVRLIARDDPHQVAVADAFVSRGAWVSLVVLVETVWVLGAVYNRGRRELATAIEMLLSHKKLVLQDSDTVSMALELFRSSSSLEFSDCLILQLARKAGHLPLGTFDRGLAKIEGAQKL